MKLLLGCAILLTATSACGSEQRATEPADSTTTDSSAVTDAGPDLGPCAGDAWWTNWDAPTFEVPPAVGMYPGNDGGPCGTTGCAEKTSACYRNAGWCCEGVIQDHAPYWCVCGDSLGCLPPQVCCSVGAYVPSCKDSVDCHP